jgi:predicted nuclease with TOPRIM domain
LTGKPEDKYAFFTKATELERIDRSYANTVDNINDLKTRKESVEQTMHSAIAMVKKLRKEWEQFEALDKMEDVVAETTLDLCWATFRDFDMDVVDQEQVSLFPFLKILKHKSFHGLTLHVQN